MVVLTGQSSNSLWQLVNRASSSPIAPPSQPGRAPVRSFRFTKEQINAVIEAYTGGDTMADLAKRYGVRRTTISALLKRKGVPLRAARAMSEAEIDQAVQLYTSGLSLQKVGDRLGWDHNTIYRHVKRRGVAMRSPNDYQHPDV